MLPEFILERRFNAPRELVWRCWTEPALVARWYGPGVETLVHDMDVRPGGLWLNEMRAGGGSHYQRVEYTEVTPPERLVWLHSVASEDWEIISNPMMADWPRVLRTVVTFTGDGDGTSVRLVWTPHKASDAEIACFRAALEGLGKGWGKGMEMLEALLAELQG